MAGLDERDLEILRILTEDARIPWRRLARTLGVSEATVYLRVRRLVEEGVIRGFTVSVDHEKVGLKTMSFILLRVDAPALREARNRLSSLRYAMEVYEIGGDYQFIVKVAAPSHDDLMTVIDEIAAVPGVREVKVLIVLRKLRDGVSIVEAVRAWFDRLRRR